MKVRILKEKKKDCFQEKDFDSKSQCIQSQKGFDEKRGNAYVASVLRDKGELKEVEELDEISGVGGISGAGGVPFSTKDEIEKFNKKEEDISKLNELFSTSGTMGGVRIRFVSAETEHEGHVERSMHQRIKNVMEEEEDI